MREVGERNAYKICMKPRMATPWSLPRTGMKSSKNQDGHETSERTRRMHWKMMKRWLMIANMEPPGWRGTL